MGVEDAQSFLDELKASDPEMGRQAKIVPISLKRAYDITSRSKEKQDSLIFEFIATQEQIKFALDILNKDKSKAAQLKTINAIPLFYGIGGPNKGYFSLSDRSGTKKIIPLFFRKQDLEASLAELGQQNPTISESTLVKVTTLDEVFQALLKEADDAVEQLTLIPSVDAVQTAIQLGREDAPSQGKSRKDEDGSEESEDASKDDAVQEEAANDRTR